MRLQQYINEDYKQYEGYIKYKKEIEDIKKLCKPYIDLVKKTKPDILFLYKGMNDSYDFKIRTTRKNRTPLNMPLKLHNYIDNLFKKKFGVKLRSETLFVTNDAGWASDYGIVNIVIPIGKFDYYWNPEVNDLYEYLPFSINKLSKNIEKYKEEIQKTVDGYKKNKDFKKMMDFDGEIMLKCKYYYAIGMEYEEIVNFIFY